MRADRRRTTARGAALTGAAGMIVPCVIAGCSALTPWVSPSPTAAELMPGPASIWLTSEPAAPLSPVDVVMTSATDAGVRFAHTFAAGQPLRGSFATSQGSYTLAALDGRCSLLIVMGSDDAADVVLTLGPGPDCSLALARRGRLGEPGMHHADDAILITNRDAAAATPLIEPEPVSTVP